MNAQESNLQNSDANVLQDATDQTSKKTDTRSRALAFSLELLIGRRDQTKAIADMLIEHINQKLAESKAKTRASSKPASTTKKTTSVSKTSSVKKNTKENTEEKENKRIEDSEDDDEALDKEEPDELTENQERGVFSLLMETSSNSEGQREGHIFWGIKTRIEWGDKFMIAKDGMTGEVVVQKLVRHKITPESFAKSHRDFDEFSVAKGVITECKNHMGENYREMFLVAKKEVELLKMDFRGLKAKFVNLEQELSNVRLEVRDLKISYENRLIKAEGANELAEKKFERVAEVIFANMKKGKDNNDEFNETIAIIKDVIESLQRKVWPERKNYDI